MQRNRRVIGWLLDHLKDYPFSYGQHGTSDLIAELIQLKFESRIGLYLEKRFQNPDWTNKYQVGRLVLNSRKINQTSITNWPAVTDQFEKKFFNEKQPAIPFKIKVMDCSDLHT
jgi:hypothetical protein